MQQRLEYIDALRGLAIMLVVMMHIPQYGFGLPMGGFYMKCATMLAVPLFFFISGLLSHGELAPPNLSTYRKRVGVILVPTIVIGGFYTLLNHMDMETVMLDKFKAGYWFTITLFEYYVIHDFVKMMACKRQVVYDVMLIVVAFACYVVAMPTVQKVYANYAIPQMLGLPQWKYFIFYVLGIFMRRYSHVLQSERGGFGILLLFILAYGSNAIGEFRWSGLLYNANLLLQEVAIVLAAYYVFSKSQNIFSSTTRLGKCMVALGTHTLEIYLLHYFALPRHLDLLFDVNALSSNPLMSMGVVGLASVCVIGVVWGVIHLLRSNSMLRAFLWGGR